MKFKSNSKQRIKVIQGLRSFKNTLPTKVKKIINKKGQIYSKTLENWKKIVGDELFKVCYPKSIKSSFPTIYFQLSSVLEYVSPFFSIILLTFVGKVYLKDLNP